jgi:bacterioferritin
VNVPPGSASLLRRCSLSKVRQKRFFAVGLTGRCPGGGTVYELVRSGTASAEKARCGFQCRTAPILCPDPSKFVQWKTPGWQNIREIYHRLSEAYMSILSDVKEIQAKMREAMQNGPVTPYYTLPLDKVYEVLNAALASEIICVLRYKQHYYMTTSIHQEQLQGLFKEHWLDEEKHLELIADRIKQLGGVPDLNPNGISKRAFSSFESGHTLADLLREDLLAERVVIKIYSDIIEFFGKEDPVSRRMFEGILKDEEDHADEIADLLYTVDPKTGKTVEQFGGDSVSKPFKA